MHTLCAGHFAFNVSSPPMRQEVTEATQQILGWPKKSFRFFVTAYGKTRIKYNWQSRLPASLRAGPGSSRLATLLPTLRRIQTPLRLKPSCGAEIKGQWLGEALILTSYVSTRTSLVTKGRRGVGNLTEFTFRKLHWKSSRFRASYRRSIYRQVERRGEGGASLGQGQQH